MPAKTTDTDALLSVIKRLNAGDTIRWASTSEIRIDGVSKVVELYQMENGVTLLVDGPGNGQGQGRYQFSFRYGDEDIKARFNSPTNGWEGKGTLEYVSLVADNSPSVETLSDKKYTPHPEFTVEDLSDETIIDRAREIMTEHAENY